MLGGRHRGRLLSADGKILFLDNFIEPIVPITLDGHILDTGEVWDVSIGTYSINPSGLLTATGTGENLASITTPLSADNTVEQSIVLDGVSVNGVATRKTDDSNFWLVRYVQSSNTLQIFTRIAGGFALRDSAIVAPAPVNLCSIASGNTVTGEYNGATVSFTSTFNNTANTVGIRNDNGAKCTKYTATEL